MNSHRSHLRSRPPARTVRPIAPPAQRLVVLDSVGFVVDRRGRGVLRLKLVGPVADLNRLRLPPGARLAIARGQLTGEAA